MILKMEMNPKTNKLMKKYLGIDPGKLGAFSVLDENSEILQLIPMPLIGNEYDKNEIRQILKSSECSRIGLENPSLIHGAENHKWYPSKSV